MMLSIQLLFSYHIDGVQTRLDVKSLCYILSYLMVEEMQINAYTCTKDASNYDHFQLI